jgi:stage II sporulation protein AA (anti-sigma F factor antagonist)
VAELDNDPPATIAIETQLDASGSAIVILSGELDASNVASLETAMASVTARAPKRVTFDLSALGFMDSSGIAVLINTAAKVSEVHLHQPSSIIRRVLETTGLSSLLTVEP